jgi:predicted protein tyrosine phosphatase
MTGEKNKLFHMVMQFAGGGKRYFVLAVFSAAVSIAFTFLMPQIVGFTVDSVIGTKQAALPAFLESLYDRLGGRDYLRANLILCAAGVARPRRCWRASSVISTFRNGQGDGELYQKLRTRVSHITPRFFLAY